MRKKKEEVIAAVEEPVVVEKPKDTPDYYLLRIGETLEDVAKKFNLDIKDLKELNGTTIIGGNQIKLR